MKQILVLRTEAKAESMLIRDAETNEVQIVPPMILPKTFRRSTLCIDKCKFQAGKTTQKIEDTVQCHLCQHWIHPSCVGEAHKDIIGIWTCTSCRSTPDVIHTMFDMIVEM